MGHLFRSLNLVQALKKKGYSSKYYINSHTQTEEILKSNEIDHEIVDFHESSFNWEEEVIERDKPEIWINDRLNTNFEHSQRIVKKDIPLVTFDDKGTGAVFADIHFAPLIFEDINELEGKRVLSGVDYLPLNNEIKNHRRIRNQLESIVISMGGSDTYGVTLKVMDYVRDLDVSKTILLGPSFMHEEELRDIDISSVTIKKNVPSLIQEFSLHDLAITGGGVTPFEANASGLPCVVVASEDFEIPVCRVLEGYGGAIFAGHHTKIDRNVFAMNLDISAMSSAASRNISLNGCDNVLSEIESLLN